MFKNFKLDLKLFHIHEKIKLNFFVRHQTAILLFTSVQYCYSFDGGDRWLFKNRQHLLMNWDRIDTFKINCSEGFNLTEK
jgi:hypothetical protein